MLKIGPLEEKVRLLTSNEPFGSLHNDKMEVAQRTNNYEDYKIIMETLWKRIGDTKHHKHVAKGLDLLEFLIINGSHRIANETKGNYHVSSLRHYQYRDDHGRDLGAGVRQKAKKILSLVKDKELIKEERKKAKKINTRLMGISKTSSGWGNSAYNSDSGSDYEETPKKSKPKVEWNSSSDEDNTPVKRSTSHATPTSPSNITRPRQPSIVNPPTRIRAPSNPPKPEPPKVEHLLSLDDLLDSAPPQQQNQSQGNGFVSEPSWEETEWGNQPNDFDQSNEFDNPQQQPTDFDNENLDLAFDQNEFESGKEEDKNDLFDQFTQGLVNLDISGDTPKIQKSKETPKKGKTLNELRNEQNGLLNPTQVQSRNNPFPMNFQQQNPMGYPVQNQFGQQMQPQMYPMGGYNQGRMPPQQMGGYMQPRNNNPFNQ